MSIMLYSGTPGSYKSYHAVKYSIDFLKHGGNVITNFPLLYQKRVKKIKGVYEQIDNMTLTIDYLVNFAIKHHKKGVKAQTLLVIDEASIKFNSREFSNKDRLDWIKFFANHRHFNFDVILIAQQDRMIDRQIRSLIETEYKHRALKSYGFLGFICNLVFRGCFMVVEYWYPVRTRVGSSFGVFHKRIADCYDTMGLFVDSNNKMSVARMRADAELALKEKNKKRFKISDLFIRKRKEVKIKDVKDKKTLHQVNKDMSELVNVLCAYVNEHGNS